MRDAQAFRAKGENSAAVIQLKNIIKQEPNNLEAHFLLGTVFSDAGELLDAERELRIALRLGTAPERFLPYFGRVLLEMERFQQVIDDVRVDDDFSPQVAAEIALLRGRAYLGLRNTADAMSQFSLALLEKAVDAKVGLAATAVAAGDLASAEAQTEQALAAAPSSAEAWVMKGDLLRAATKPDEALAAYAKATQLKPDLIAALLGQASVHLAAGAPDAARAALAKAGRFAPGSPRVHYANAVLSLHERKYDDAQEHLKRVLQVIPEHMPSVLVSGALSFSTGALEQAQTSLVTFLKRHPGNVYGRKMLAATLLKKAQPQSAASLLEPLLARVANDAELFALAGQAYMQSGQIDKARDALKKAVAVAPKDAK